MNILDQLVLPLVAIIAGLAIIAALIYTGDLVIPN